MANKTDSYRSFWTDCCLALLTLIFFGLFFSRKLQRLTDTLDLLELIIILISIAALLAFIIKKKLLSLDFRIFSKGKALLSTIIYLVLLAATYDFVPHKIEIMHFLQFSMLSASLLFAWASGGRKYFSTNPYIATLVAFSLSLAIGVIEEILQQYVPERFYDPRDIILNAFAAALGAALALLSLKNQNNRD